MSKTKAIIGVCLVFILGVITGVAMTARFVQKQVHRLVEGGPEELNAVIIRRLDHELQLDGEQRRQLQEIVENASTEIRDARKEIQPKLAAIRADAVAKARAILRPDQQPKFDAMVERLRENGGPASGSIGLRPIDILRERRAERRNAN